MSRTVKKGYKRQRVQTKIKDTKTRVVQSEKDSSDINNIVARAHHTGQLPVLNKQHIEVMPDVQSYQDAMNKVVFAQQAFEQLPSQIRAKFDNDPSKMLEAISASSTNPEIKDQLTEIGLFEKEIAPLVSESNGGEATAEPVAVEETATTETTETTNA